MALQRASNYLPESSGRGAIYGVDVLVDSAGSGKVSIAGITALRDASINATGDVEVSGGVNIARHVNWSGKSLAIGSPQSGTMTVGGNANLRATDGDVTIASTTKVTGGAATLTAEHGSVVLNGDLSASAATLRALGRIDRFGHADLARADRQRSRQHPGFVGQLRIGHACVPLSRAGV